MVVKPGRGFLDPVGQPLVEPLLEVGDQYPAASVEREDAISLAVGSYCFEPVVKVLARRFSRKERRSEFCGYADE